MSDGRIRNRLAHLTEHLWYGREHPHPLLLPLEAAFRHAVLARQSAYRCGRKPSERLPVPVIVVGNLTVGGTGKTPLTIWLARFLQRQGYGGQRQPRPLAVTGETDPRLAGDEPVLIARRSGCPVSVFPRRAEAGRALLDATDCTLIIADDGLQHYALQRDLEIAVVDGLRRFGNGHLLPAGPLREPVERLDSVDLVIHTGTAPAGGHRMTLEGTEAINLAHPHQRKPLSAFAGQPVLALAGIGHPERFFRHLAAQGLICETRAFPDHHPYRAEDLSGSADRPLIMTEKDAVKCRAFGREHHWYVPVSAHVSEGFESALLDRLPSAIGDGGLQR